MSTTNTPVPTAGVRELLPRLAQHFFDHQLVEQLAPILKSSLAPNRQIIVAAMPKSGSTFLIRTMHTVLNRPWNLATFASGDMDESLYFPVLVRDTCLRSALCKLHMRATRANIELLSAFNITPIVLVRRLFDIVASQRDHIARDQNLQPSSGNMISHFRSLSLESQFDYIIEMQLPWFVEFYRSWFEAEKDGKVAIHWLQYEQLNQRPVQAIAGALEFVGESADVDRIGEAIDALPRDRTRFNKGVIGRGDELLSDTQKQRIVGLCRHFPWVDFSRLGIDVA